MEEDPVQIFRCAIDEQFVGELEERAQEFGKELHTLSYDEAGAVLVHFVMQSMYGSKTGTARVNERMVVDAAQDGTEAFDGFLAQQATEQLINRVRTSEEIVLEIMRNKKVWERGKRLRKKIAVETYRYQNDLGDRPADE